MTVPMTPTSAHPRRLGRSAAAVFLGFITVVVLSLGTDQVLHVLQVYPPWGQPMHDPGLNLLALSYRIVYTVLGGYITARLAPHAPLGHALVLGAVGFAAGLAGAIATIPMHLGPAWYPIALVVTALPCAWLGGTLYLRRHADR
jgi:ABC-type branched-subunit amino acid transport system permease subunit